MAEADSAGLTVLVEEEHIAASKVYAVSSAQPGHCGIVSCRVSAWSGEQHTAGTDNNDPWSHGEAVRDRNNDGEGIYGRKMKKPEKRKMERWMSSVLAGSGVF